MSEPCVHFQFGLMVTGQSEEEHLPKLFKSLEESGLCHFRVIRRIGQRSPIEAKDRQIRMVGTGRIIPDKDADDIGFPARRFLSRNSCAFLLLIDDLEHDRRMKASEVFQRYSIIFDTLLKRPDLRKRASVHFLVNMLEAYYFGDLDAINLRLGTQFTEENIPYYPDDLYQDVENIRHPKNELKKIMSGFDEKEDGGRILETLDIERVLSKPDTCASLRTLFAWCHKVIQNYPYYEQSGFSDQYQLEYGVLSVITGQQLENL